MIRHALFADIFTPQTQLLHNLAQVLEASGSGLENVLKMNVYILSMDEFGAMNEGYKPFFPGVLPVSI